MADKIDIEDPAVPASDGDVARAESNNIDDEVTAAISQKTVRALGGNGATNDDIAGGNIATGRIRLTDNTVTHASVDDEALQPGYLLSERFEIVALVHSGGMGHVYKAVDLRRQRSGTDQVHVAIKMMRRSVAPQLDARLALEREAARTQRLSHPNIVTIYDFDEHEEHFFLIMEWLEGESANALLRRTSGRPLATQFAWQIIHGIAQGLHHAHTHNVVHADVNPSNIFITDTQEIKLLDFGVARHSSEPQVEAEDGIVWATHSYASPEVLSGLPPTFEDDIFSLGCIAYRALTGRHPFASMSSTEAMDAGMTPERVPGLAENQWQILRQALSYQRSNRPASATAFLVDLPASSDVEPVDRTPARTSFRWAPIVTMVTAIAVTTGTWWIMQVTSNNQPLIADTPPIDAGEPAVSAAPLEPSRLDLLLGSATQAMNDLRFIEPENDNARSYYREALAIDLTNSEAASGLRRISDVYVQQADTALRAGNPASAIIALTVATETDSLNPSIAIVNQLLMAQANGELASARLAAAEGDGDRARELLAGAERFGVINAAEIDELRSRIAQDEWERAFLGLLAEADAAVASGRLIAPPEDNAHAQLMELQSTYGNEPRLVTSMERLSQNLLIRAEFERTAARFPEAAGFLDSAITLGVLIPEVMAAQDALQLAIDEAAEAEAAALAESEAAISIAASGSVVDENGEFVQVGAADGVPALSQVSTDADSGLAPTIAEESDAAVTNQLPEPEMVSFSDLRVERRVAPRFPARATEREMSGSVDLRFNVNTDGSTGEIEIVGSEPGTLFVSSARNAVRQWRFERPDRVIRTEVKLRFDWTLEE